MSDRDERERRDVERSPSRERGGGETREARDGDPPLKERDAETTSLLVRNISYRVRADELRRVFSKYGELRDVYIPEDYYTRQPKGFAFVEFYNRRDADDAIDQLERYELDGRQLSIVHAKDRRKTPDEMRPRDRNRGGRDDRRGGGGYDDRRYDDRGRGGGYDDRRPVGRSRSRSRERDYRGDRREPPRYDDRRPVSPPRGRARSGSDGH